MMKVGDSGEMGREISVSVRFRVRVWVRETREGIDVREARGERRRGWDWASSVLCPNKVLVLFCGCCVLS